MFPEANYRFCPSSEMPIIAQLKAIFSILLFKAASLSCLSAGIRGTDHAKMDFCIKSSELVNLEQLTQSWYVCPAYQASQHKAKELTQKLDFASGEKGE